MSFVNENEIAAAEQTAAKVEKENLSLYTHIFATPYTFGETTYEKMEFNFGKLTGGDCLAIEAEMQALGKPLIAPEFSGEFLIRTAARAAGVGSDVLMAMPMADYNRIRNRARSFLLRSGL